MALAFIFAFLAQRLPLVGDQFDADTLHRMQQREAYLREQMTKLLLEIEERSREQSRMGMQALLFAALPYWKILFVIGVFITLFWFMRKISREFRGVEDGRDEEQQEEEEIEQQEQQEVEEEEEEVEEEEINQPFFLPDLDWPTQNERDDCERMYDLLHVLIVLAHSVLSDSFDPVLGKPVKAGTTREDLYPLENDPVFRVLVPLSAPRGHVFHLELGAAGELPARNSRIRVELECTCGREEELDMLCFLHTSEEELRDQQPSLLKTLCTGSYLDVEKIARWFLVLLRKVWKCVTLSRTHRFSAVLSKRSCMLRLPSLNRTSLITEVVFGVQQDGTDIFLSSQETTAGWTPSTTWPQSCAVAEAKFFQHIASRATEDNFYLKCLQVCAYILVGYNFSAYELKTVLMHLLNTAPLQSWCGSYFLQRMEDIMRYLRCCVEEKRLHHFLIGNEAVPEEIVLPPEFRASRPLNLFQHLEQDAGRHERALQEWEYLQDRLTRVLNDGN